MLHLKSFCFNPFQENTYLLYDENNEAFIFDPGNYSSTENETLKNFIHEKQLKPTRLLLTHAHIDHILGVRFVSEEYGLSPEVHAADLPFIERMEQSAANFGLNCATFALPQKFISEGDKISLGNYTLHCIFAPGHSPGSICFYNQQNNFVIGGDVLFNGSIGRTDLPMGHHETLIRSIREKLFILPDETKVFPGHGPSTSIGHERATNHFLI